MRGAGRRILYALSLLGAGAAGVVVVLLFGTRPAPPPTLPASQPTEATTQPATTQPAPTAALLSTYAQILSADFPNNPPAAATSTSLDLSDAAHLVLPRRVYLCPRGDLWFTDANSDPLPKVLDRAANETEHVASRQVEYILWGIDSRGNQQARAVCRKGDGYELVSSKSSPLPVPARPGLDWSRAMDWDDDGVTRLIVPTTSGVDILTVDQQITEAYCPLRDSGSGPVPQVLFDLRGLLAWIPADDGIHAGTVVARFVGGHWTKLDATNWPGSILHLVPMLDGSVLQIRRAEDPQNVELVTEPLDSPAIDESQISALVDQLDDPDPEKRSTAYDHLLQYGAGIFPILQKLRPDASPIAGPRIDQILASTTQYNLAGMEIQGGQLTVAARLSDGGAVFCAPLGVTMQRENRPPLLINTAYLVLRPGRYVQLLPSGLAKKLADQTQVLAFHDEWATSRSDVGISRFLPPDQITPLLRSSELGFTRWVGVDNRGRWIFRRPDADQPTLILDPSVLDPSPRLAVWTINSGMEVGWNAAGWPVVRRNSDRWMLTDHDWELLAAGDAAQTAVAPPGNLLLTDSAGNKYLDGRSTITVVHPNGRQDVWNLPDEIAGSDGFQPWLVSIGQGRFLLFNANGRIARLRSDGAGFAVEAIFDKRLGFLRSIHRVWTDPAGRVAVSCGNHLLAIIFANGRVDPAIADQILSTDLKRIDPR
jgi:hypothetical protein